MKRPIGDSSQRSRNRRATLRLLLEPLETRSLLAGVNVSVILDQDGSRGSDPADMSASRRLVYLDLNQNRRQDDSDPIAVTNDRGVATFSDIAPGVYGVALVGGSQTQKQTFPVSVEEIATQIARPSAFVVASNDHSRIWTIDNNGKAQSLAGDRSLSADLPGPVSSAVIVGNDAWLIVTPTGRTSNILMRFDLATGLNQPLPFLGSNGRTVSYWVNAGSSVVARLTGPNGTEFATLKELRGQVSVSNSVSVSSNAKLFGSPTQDNIAVVETTTSTFIASPSPTSASQSVTTSLLSVYHSQSLTRVATKRLRGEASEVTFSSDGKIFAAFRNGGVEVFRNDSLISEVALLPEASTPLATNSTDGRFVTGNKDDNSELIVWDAENWLPIARTFLPGDGSASKILLSNHGDQWIASGAQGVFQADLAKPAQVLVTVLDGQQNTAELGVRLERTNSVPMASSSTIQMVEDSPKFGQLLNLARDNDQDALWFSILSNPAHGRIELTPFGDWTYVPIEDYSGMDRATIRVMDGQASTELTLTFNVAPVNDPPEQMQFNLTELVVPEHPKGGMSLGQVLVKDPDANANYRFSTSDPRFQIRNGQLFLAPDANFDFEQQSAIQLEVTAVDDSESGYQITSLTTINIGDVNEPPTAVRVLNTSVAENALGMSIGDVIVDDPDNTNHFAYTVSDSRFEIVNGQLRLKPDAKLDYELSPMIDVTITAEDGSDTPVFTTVQVEVLNQNDPPTAINITTTGIEENRPGAVVGTLAVVDQDQQAYTYTVSDPRFEVVDGKLKLSDDQTITKAQGLTVALTVTATSGNSDKISKLLIVPVNTPLPMISVADVNRDGEITPIDAILVITYLNQNGAGPKPEGTGSGEDAIDYDVNGDGIISPLDVLIIIRQLNERRNRRGASQADGEAPPTLAGLSVVSSNTNSPEVCVSPVNDGADLATDMASSSLVAAPGEGFDHSSTSLAMDAKSAASIDSELEGLLEQISLERLKRKKLG